MKKVVFTLAAVAATAVLTACKNEVPVSDDPTAGSNTSEVELAEDLALADPETNAIMDKQYRYVTAYSGLTLREYDNLQSKKLARMPYGSKVKIVEAEEDATMNISGINGGMDKVAFNHKTGFAFNGYLSRFFPPELNITPKGYADELRQFYPDVQYLESVGGSLSNPSKTETLLLPGAQWHEAFFIAQRLFDFPKEFDYPNPSGKEFETIVDQKPKRNIWTSQLEVTRVEDGHKKIEYVYSSKKYRCRVTVEKEGGAMKITKSEVLK